MYSLFQLILLFFFSFSVIVSFVFVLISILLGEIFECERNFERILLGAIFGSNAPFFIAGWRSDFIDQVQMPWARFCQPSLYLVSLE